MNFGVLYEIGCGVLMYDGGMLRKAKGKSRKSKKGNH